MLLIYLIKTKIQNFPLLLCNFSSIFRRVTSCTNDNTRHSSYSLNSYKQHSLWQRMRTPNSLSIIPFVQPKGHKQNSPTSLWIAITLLLIVATCNKLLASISPTLATHLRQVHWAGPAYENISRMQPPLSLALKWHLHLIA